MHREGVSVSCLGTTPRLEVRPPLLATMGVRPGQAVTSVLPITQGRVSFTEQQCRSRQQMDGWMGGWIDRQDISG